MKKLSLYIFLVLMWCNVGFAEIITYNCKFPEGGEKFNGQFKFDLELKELLEVGEYDGTLVKAVPEMNTDLLAKFLLPFGKEGLSIDNGYENEISFGIEYAKGTRAYFFINREKSAMIIHIFTYFTLKQKGELFKIMDKKVEENLKNSKHPYDKVIGIVVHHAIENFSENYLGKAVGKCR